MLKMSMFLKSKKIILEGDFATISRPTDELNGEIEIKAINQKIIKQIQEETSSNISDIEKMDTVDFAYKIFPIITNIEMDIDLEDFKLLIDFPRKPFSLVWNLILEEITDVFDSIKSTKKINEKTENIFKENKEFIESVKEIKQHEKAIKTNKLELLYNELENNFKDREKRDFILKQINELKEEIDNMK